MSLLEDLQKEEVWKDFFEYRQSHEQLSKREIRELSSFLAEKRYERYSDLSFSVPEKRKIAKQGSSKKRVIYTLPADEMWMLKLLAFLLHKYDRKLRDSCYAFRKDRSVRDAFEAIRKIPDLSGKCIVKADIHDYFNSIDADILSKILKEILEDDEELFCFMERFLHIDKTMEDGVLLNEKRGAMAGIPLASFFANFYLLSLDVFFEEKKIPYFRYSDDILFICETKEEADRYFQYLKDHLKDRGLLLNEEKVFFYGPHEPFEFLGLRYEEGEIDLSKVTLEKMKARIRRKARAIYRNRKRKGLSYEKAAVSLIHSLDRKLYDLFGDNSYTWTKWYFPLLTKTDGLHAIDETILEYLRFLRSGRHYKGNYQVSYEDLKKLGYTSLVHEYYTWKKEEKKLKEQ